MTPILERGGRITAFEHSFQCYSHKCFVKFSRKGGGGGSPKSAHEVNYILR